MPVVAQRAGLKNNESITGLAKKRSRSWPLAFVFYVPLHNFSCQKYSNWQFLCLPLDEKNYNTIDTKIEAKQAGAELGQAQLTLGLSFTLVYLYWIDDQEIYWLDWRQTLPTTEYK